MLRPHHLLLLVALLVDGGTVAPLSDAGTGTSSTSASASDAGMGATQANPLERDAGTVTSKPLIVDGVRWPAEVRTLATLDGPAVIAAHAAMQHLLARIMKEERGRAGRCEYSPKAMDVIVGEGDGMYIVRINRRVDRCGRADASFNAAIDWLELYAVSPEGRVLARYPSNL